MAYLFWVFVYLLMFFYNAIYTKIPGGQYVDEIICFLFVFFALIKWISAKKKYNENKNLLICVSLIFFVGIISTLINQYVIDVVAVIKDIFLTVKFFITYASAVYVMENYRSRLLKKYIVRVSKILLMIIFSLSIISLFYDIGMSGSERYGFRAYQFIFSHYTYLAFNIIILMCAIDCENKKNTIYSICGIIILLLTLRTKAMVFAAVYLIIKLFIIIRRKNINILQVLKIRYTLPIFIVAIIVALPTINLYISWGSDYNLRNGLYLKGLQIAQDHFPFGSGFGTFATNISVNYNSPIYSKYNMLSYQGFGSGQALVSDVFWPSVYAQFGFIGFILYVQAIRLIVKNIVKNNKKNEMSIIFSSLLILVYSIIASTAEAFFTNESGVFSVIYIVIFNCFKNDEGLESLDYSKFR